MEFLQFVFLYFIQCIIQSIDTTQSLQENLIIRKSHYFVAHPNSIIFFESLNAAVSSCIIQSNATIFYNYSMCRLESEIKITILKNKYIYFIPKANSIIDISKYTNLIIEYNFQTLELKYSSQPCMVNILNPHNIILKNILYNNNSFKIARDKQCTIYCTSPTSIKCRNSFTNEECQIPQNTLFKCILKKNNLFWLYNPNDTYILKNFTQCKSDTDEVKLKYISNTLFLSGIYTTSCFNGLIQLPRINGRIYKIETPFKNELYLIPSSKATSMSNTQWKYSNKINTLVQDIKYISSYNMSIKIKRYLTKIIEKIKPLLIKPTGSLVQVKQCTDIMQSKINKIKKQQITNSKLNEIIKLLENTILHLIKNKKSLDCCISHKTEIENVVTIINLIIDKINNKLKYILNVSQTGIIKNLEKEEQEQKIVFDEDREKIEESEEKIKIPKKIIPQKYKTKQQYTIIIICSFIILLLLVFFIIYLTKKQYIGFKI